MDRRRFLKLALLTSGMAVAGYGGYELLQMSNASVRSLATQTLTNQTILANQSRIGSEGQIPHLLRRAGFGASPSELATYQKLGLTGAIDQLLNYKNVDDTSVLSQPNITMQYTLPPPSGEAASLIWWWVNRMVMTKRPLEEKMTLFWHNHFATAILKVRSPYLMFKQNQLLRSKAMDPFEDLLMGITEDPAMLIWLDGYRNIKNAPNENYAREIMEVFTFGIGNYTEDDVKAGARALTGYTLTRNGDVIFNPQQHDNGTKTFLGHTGNLGPKDIVHILATHPATARKLAAELFEFFAYYPTHDIIEKFANVYTSSGGNVGVVVEAILKSDEFMSHQAYLSAIKSPVEYVVSSLRSLGGTVTPQVAIGILTNMGQIPFNPPTVFGWPSGMEWINTSSILDRFNFPLSIQNPSNLATTQDASSINNVAKALFPEGLPQEVIAVIQNANTAFTNPSDKTRNTIRLTMASPFYNLN